MISGLLTFIIPLFYLLVILITLQTGKNLGFGLIWAILGLTITFTGLGLWVSGFISLGRRALTVLPKAKYLQIGGIYKYFRHPVYYGITLTLLGLSLSLGSWLGLGYTIFIIIPLNMIRAQKEEKILLEKFGQEYINYKNKTFI